MADESPWETDDEFGITLDPCEHPSINGGVCAVCGASERERMIGRRPVRFFHYHIREDDSLWLEGRKQVVNVGYEGGWWDVDVMEFGEPTQGHS